MHSHKRLETLLKKYRKSKSKNDLTQFVEASYELLFQDLWLRAWTLSRDRSEASDKVHDFFLEKFLDRDSTQSRGFPQEEEAIKAFIFKMFVNFLRTKWATLKKYLSSHLFIEKEQFNTFQSIIENKNELSIYTDFLEYILQSNCLSANEKQLIEFKLYGLSNSAIARRLNITSNALGNRLYRLKYKLRQLFARFISNIDRPH